MVAGKNAVELTDWVDLLAAGQLWIADRNFCTKLLLFECDDTVTCFLVRHHAGASVEACDECSHAGPLRTGAVGEGRGRRCLTRAMGALVAANPRSLVDEPTAAGERITCADDLPAEVSAARARGLYHGRWSIGNRRKLTLSLRRSTLCYPKAAACWLRHRLGHV